MSDKLKMLTGKNPKDFEPIAYNLVNIPDVDLFSELVNKDDFLFDFVKQNVASRIEKNINKTNYLNLIKFLKYYSPSYEDLIVSTLAKYADEDLTDTMLDILENGTEDEKTYCAQYFSRIQDPLALDSLRENAYSQNSYLSTNCISTLAAFGDREIYNNSIEKLQSEDEFEQLEGVKYLVSYGDKNALPQIINTIKTSSMAENMAAEVPYLCNLFELIQTNKDDGLYVLNLIINGFGEISSLSQVFDFQMYEIFEHLINTTLTPQSATILINAKDKFNTLTENDEYMYDEPKDVKQEILDIKKLLTSIDKLEPLIEKELDENSLFVYTALDYTNNTSIVRELLNSQNQTIVLKAIETLKKLNNLTQEDKNNALKNTTNENIKNIINAI
ncbi:hypothetical protein IJ596_01325 [bacterium]|nr:hypothetical protein [bacterium]